MNQYYMEQGLQEEVSITTEDKWHSQNMQQKLESTNKCGHKMNPMNSSGKKTKCLICQPIVLYHG